MTDGSAVERRIVTVLFADLAGFTTLSEQLDAEDVAAIQDAYFGAVRETVGRYGGTLEKFIGDAAMAVFGAPRARDDDAERAVRAGLALVSTVEQLSARLGLDAGQLQLRVGINSGEVAHAVAGPDAGRVTGDTVNVAARLQTAAEPGTVLLGELTALAVEESVELGAVAEITVKGKAEPLRVRSVLAPRLQPSREDALGGLHAPIVGRDRELGHVLDALRDTARRRTARRLVLIAPPGIGKTRLLSEVAHRAAEQGVAIMRAKVRPQAAGPYDAVAELLEAALEGQEPVPAIRAALTAAGRGAEEAQHIEREVLALLRPVLATGHATAGGESLSEERAARMGAWCAALDALASGRQSLWLVEDVHWASGDLLAFLAQAEAEPTVAGRLLLASARPSLRETEAGWLGEPAEGDRLLELEPLPMLDAAALISALVGDALPPDLVSTVAQRSDGNPLFIEEMLRTWISVGTLVESRTGWVLTVEPERISLPATVQAIYAAQLDDLPPDARAVARRGAVAGRRFPTAAFDALELGSAAGGLEVLRRRAFVAGPASNELVGDLYAYRHALLRDAGYASLARAERARLHVALARWLESTAGERAGAIADEIGDHYAQALASLPALGGTPVGAGLERDLLRRAAADWLERGADRALQLAAPDAAVELLQRAIAHTSDQESDDLGRRRLQVGEILANSGDLSAGVGQLRAALELYDTRLGADVGQALAHDRLGYGRAALALGQALMQQIEFGQAERLTADALDRLADAPALADMQATTARLLALHAWAVAAQGRSDGVVSEIDRAFELAQRLGDPALELEVLQRRAVIANENVGEQRPVDWADLERRAREQGQWRMLTTLLRNRAVEEMETNAQAATALLDEAAAVAKAQGLTESLGWAEYGRSALAFVSGDWDAALELGDRALSIGERYAYKRLVFRSWMMLLPILAARAGTGRPHATITVGRHDLNWEGAPREFPTKASPYGQVLMGATALHRALVLGEEYLPPVGLVEPMSHVFDNPDHLAAREAIIAAWLRAGLLDPARQAAASMDRACGEPDAGQLRCASAGLLGAWLALASADGAAVVDRARWTIEHASRPAAAWWTARAIRCLEAAGSADESLLAEAAALEARMGIPAQHPPVGLGGAAR